MAPSDYDLTKLINKNKYKQENRKNQMKISLSKINEVDKWVTSAGAHKTTNPVKNN